MFPSDSADLLRAILARHRHCFDREFCEEIEKATGRFERVMPTMLLMRPTSDAQRTTRRHIPRDPDPKEVELRREAVLEAMASLLPLARRMKAVLDDHGLGHLVDPVLDPTFPPPSM